MPTVYQQLIAAGRSESGQALIEALGDCPLNVTPSQYAEANQALSLGRQTAATNGWAISYWLLKQGAYAKAAAGDMRGAIAIAASLWPSCGDPTIVFLPSSGTGAPPVMGSVPPAVAGGLLPDSSTLWLIGIALGAALLIKRWSDAQ